MVILHIFLDQWSECGESVAYFCETRNHENVEIAIEYFLGYHKNEIRYLQEIFFLLSIFLEWIFFLKSQLHFLLCHKFSRMSSGYLLSHQNGGNWIPLLQNSFIILWSHFKCVNWFKEQAADSYILVTLDYLQKNCKSNCKV